MSDYQDVWQKDIPDGAPFEIELREPSPKTVPMTKGGTFDKWKAGLPRSNPLHQGGENEIEYCWLMLVSNHLKEALRVAGAGRVTIVATRSGDDEKFEVSKGWTSSAGSTGGEGSGSRNLSYGNGRAGRALPEGETAARYLGALLRATSLAHHYLRASKSIAEIAEDLNGDGRSSFESTILIAAGKIAHSASIAALDSDQDFAEQMKQLVGSRASDSSSTHPAGSSAPRPPDDPYEGYPSSADEEGDQDDLPF